MIESMCYTEPRPQSSVSFHACTMLREGYQRKNNGIGYLFIFIYLENNLSLANSCYYFISGLSGAIRFSMLGFNKVFSFSPHSLLKRYLYKSSMYRFVAVTVHHIAHHDNSKIKVHHNIYIMFCCLLVLAKQSRFVPLSKVS